MGLKIVRKEVSMKSNIWIYFLTSIFLSLSMSLTNFATFRLSGSTESLFKSTRLVPVMIGNIIIVQRTPKFYAVLSLCLITIGLVALSITDIASSSRSDIHGIIAVMLSLSFDSIAFSLEEKLMLHEGASQSEVLSFVYGIGATSVGIIALVTGAFQSGISNIIHSPSSLVPLIIYIVTGAVGIQFVFLSVKVFGSLTACIFTSLRKTIFTVYRMRSHFSVFNGISLAILTCGIAIHVFSDIEEEKELFTSMNNPNILSDIGEFEVIDD